MNLQGLRAEIDELDDQIVALLNKRAGVAQKVGAVKGRSQKFSPGREAEVISRALHANDGPFKDASLIAIYREIIGCCLALEQPLRISYLGPAGTYSEEAARKRFGAVAELMPCVTLDEVLAAAEGSNAELCVLPVENSTEGTVNRTLDLLHKTRLTVVGEIALPIHHQLLSKAEMLADIKIVAAHPQALAQCRDWLQKHLPHAEQRAMNSNAQAAQAAAADPALAAVAGALAAKKYELPALAQNIEDDHANTTRFMVLGRQGVSATGSDKTSLICTIPNRPGSLGKLITVLAEAGINMTSLTSRPSPTDIWDYIFYIDVDGHKDDPPVAKALAGLQDRAASVKVLGSYPKDAV
jgi:chorismate mutase/prephenate dehydratase